MLHVRKMRYVIAVSAKRCKGGRIIQRTYRPLTTSGSWPNNRQSRTYDTTAGK